MSAKCQKLTSAWRLMLIDGQTLAHKIVIGHGAKKMLLIDFHRCGTRIAKRGEKRNVGGTETATETKTVKLVAPQLSAQVPL